MTRAALATDQSETFYFDRERSPGAYITLPSTGVDEDRNQYLREGIAKMIRRARRYMRAKDGEGTRWTEGYAGRIIEWALLLKEEGLVQATTADVEAPIDHQGSEVVAKVDEPLLTAKGRAPVNSHFAAYPGDGEWHIPENDRLRGIDRQIGLIELNNGNWLAHPDDGLFTYSQQFPSREAALRNAIAGVIRYQRMIVRDRKKLSPMMVRGDAPDVIRWALSLKPARADDRVIEDSASGHSGSLNQPTAIDPVIRSLCESHRARKIFPAGHTFAMTNPVINGHMVTLGTCSCGETFSYAYGSAGHERMDAAIEAHWQKFDCVADKIDGRGEPIGAEAAAAKPKRKKKSQPDAPGQPASIASAPDSAGIHGADAPSSDIADAAPRAMRSEPAPHAPPSGAGSPLLEAAPIGAGLVAADMAAEPQDDWSELLRAATDLAWREPQPITETQKALLDFGKVYALGRKVERPILRWHGGKWKLAPWIISHFPPHKVYIEPFGGAGSVLLQKLPVLTEVWNDLEGEIVNLFRVLRSNAADLARLIYLTPFAREEYHSLYEVVDDPIERARQFVARSFMGQSSKGALRKSGFDSRINPDGFVSRLNSLRAMPEEFHAIAERFRNVVIEQRPAEAIFAQYDRSGVLFYVDPPYLSDRAKHYTHELDEAGHAALLETLRGLSGMVVLSGYRSELYDNALTDWCRIETEAHADGGVARVEVVWINPACAAALDQQYPALFDLAAHDVANTPPPLDDSNLAETDA